MRIEIYHKNRCLFMLVLMVVNSNVDILLRLPIPECAGHKIVVKAFDYPGNETD